MKIGIAEISASGWTGGQVYSSVAIQSLGHLATTDPDLELAVIGRADPGVTGATFVPIADAPPITALERGLRRVTHRQPRTAPLPGERRGRQFLRVKNPMDPMWVARKEECDAIFPVTTTPPMRSRGLGIVSWIPDLQHLTHPEYFAKRNADNINALVNRLATGSHRLVLSSETVREEFDHYFPQHSEKVCVLPFPSRFAFSEPNPDGDVREIYGLPARFFLCANQFWRHKNHTLVLQAMHAIREEHPEAVCVFSGLLSDGRDPTNQYVSDLLQFVATHRLERHVRILGLVPRRHFDSLLSECDAVIQPSLSEGWSTTVQDAKALGKPILALDTPILREQAPQASFFGNEVDEIASSMLRHLQAPRSPASTASSATEREFAMTFARKLRLVCEEASHAASTHIR